MTTLLVDGPNILVRGIKAMEAHPLNSSDGTSTGALVVFINTLAAHVRENRPDRLVICWDGGGSAERLRIYPQYKGNRTPKYQKPQHVRDAFALAARFCYLSGMAQYMEEGYEADDLIAHLTQHRQGHTVILSNDKDFRQLIDHNVELVRVSGGGAATDRWTIDRVQKEIGCLPGDLTPVHALTGDKSDNIPGIPRYGEKTAIKTLAKYDWDLRKALANEPRLKGRDEEVWRNLALVDLRSPIRGLALAQPPQWAPLTEQSPDWDELMAFLGGLDLNTIKGRLMAGTMWGSATLPLAFLGPNY